MGEQARRRTPQPARTDFESMTHEQLVALLDSASPEGAAQLATKLSKASSTITKIGDDLMTYVKGLEWQGEGGDAFRDWGGQSAAATLRLGQYAEVASRWLSTVAQAVAEAKAAIPATSETTQAKADLAKARKTLAGLDGVQYGVVASGAKAINRENLYVNVVDEDARCVEPAAAALQPIGHQGESDPAKLNVGTQVFIPHPTDGEIADHLPCLPVVAQAIRAGHQGLKFVK